MHRLKLSALILLFLAGAVLILLAAKWPFTRGRTIQSLEQVSSSDVRISSFQETFFPHPGYIAENVTITRGDAGSGPPLGRIAKITCRATWPALLTFTHRISRMDLEGVRIYIPSHVPAPIRKHGVPQIKAAVTELVANGTVLEIAPRHEGGREARFDFSELVANDIARKKAINFRADVRNPNPPSEITVSGAVGPLKLGKVPETPISGSYRLLHANLGSYKAIKGDLSAHGGFDGLLGRAQITGAAEIPDFEVTSSHHSVGLTTEYRAIVNGTSGDVVVESAKAHFLGTTLTARGSISGTQGKTVFLDFDGDEVRVQDLLRLFVTADQPPLKGPMTLHAHVVLPPTHLAFVKRVRVDGDFLINHAEFTNDGTQEKVDQLSARARGDKHQIKTPRGPGRVSEDLKAKIKLQDGIATIPAGFFGVTGAVARCAGTYNLLTEAIDLHGEIAMDASLSAAASGVKSILLIPLDPFFRKKGAGAVLPVRAGGTYSHPVFKVSLRH